LGKSGALIVKGKIDRTAANRMRRYRERKRNAAKALRDQHNAGEIAPVVTPPPVTIAEIVAALGQLYSTALSSIRGKPDPSDAAKLASVLAVSLRAHDGFLLEERIAELERRVPASGAPLRLVR
jgi:hypothetical protein